MFWGQNHSILRFPDPVATSCPASNNDSLHPQLPALCITASSWLQPLGGVWCAWCVWGLGCIQAATIFRTCTAQFDSVSMLHRQAEKSETVLWQGAS